MIYPNYITEYATKHRIGSDKVAKSPMLTDAAMFEFQVTQRITELKTARRAFVELYPKTNTISCICKSKCNNVCKLSVINLIRR